LGSRFEFTQRQFDLLYSDLSVYPVGHAVAASAAFPGLLTPVSLRNYPKDESYVPPAWVKEELDGGESHRLRYRQALEAQSYIDSDRSYIYLSDGGISDNLGVLPVIQLISDMFPSDDSRATMNDGKLKKIVVISVNSKTSSAAEVEDTGKGLRLAQILGTATATPMGNFSEAQVALLKMIMAGKNEKKLLRERITALYGPDAVAQNFPELNTPDIDYRLVEVEFAGVSDEAERDYLNTIPTAFKLEHEQVDRLRKAAVTALDANPDYSNLVNELK
jgi:NTE family protein